MTKTIRSEGHEALRQGLITARKDAGLTQTELAERLACHQSMVARIESGERRIDVVELVVLARAIGVTAASLLGKAETSTPKGHKL